MYGVPYLEFVLIFRRPSFEHVREQAARHGRKGGDEISTCRTIHEGTRHDLVIQPLHSRYITSMMSSPQR